MNFSIIIPNYNGQDFLPSCLKSLCSAIKKQKASKFEIILVDNGSSDKSVDLFKKYTQKIPTQVIKNSKNLGFAPAVNQGILASCHPWIVVCNNDITLTPHYFQKISLVIKKNPEISVFTGPTYDANGSAVESTGLNFDYSGKCAHHKHIPSKPTLIWGAAAALTVYSKDILIKVGLFDLHFFAYEEDVDLALRLHNLAYKTMLVPLAKAFHLGGATSSKMGNFRNRMDAKNWIYLIIKNYSLKQIWQNLPGIIEQRLRNLSGLLKNTPFLLWLPTVISVYGQVIIKLPAMLIKRRQINNL